MSRSNLSAEQPAYLVVVNEYLIAQDIALTINDHDPGAKAIIAATAPQALAALSEVPRVVVAFIAEPPNHFARSALAKAIAERGGRVVLLGEEAEELGPIAEWDVLYVPFTTATLIESLTRRQGYQRTAACDAHSS